MEGSEQQVLEHQQHQPEKHGADGSQAELQAQDHRGDKDEGQGQAG